MVVDSAMKLNRLGGDAEDQENVAEECIRGTRCPNKARDDVLQAS